MHSQKNPWGIPYRTGEEIRQSFIDFFVKTKGHTFVPSSPVVPHDDPTLLFINSGMNQFKALFLGESSLDLKRAANSQKCLRVSGKHNDLDEVGRDTYHHTFFEMLGNWSFGDYYKNEALVWSWELLTEVWKLPKDRLFATVYRDDDEAEAIWRSKTDINPNHIMRFGEKSNFWEMGEVGPCGPCSEIHFDMGDPATRASTFQDPILGVNGENARYIEIWNNVFMQYERLKDGSLKPLKAKHVDTGMGFERVCSIIQGSGSNYETDLFRPLLDQIANMTHMPYDQGVNGTPHRVIADHLRALVFAIGDGATPGNEGRGYVLRRILRRASRFSQDLDQKKPFIFKLVPRLVEIMGGAYPEIRARQDFISEVIEAEETRFMRTLKDGLTRFHKILQETKEKGQVEIKGSDVFQLYDTYGFPSDLTRVLADEKGYSIDQPGFDTAMNEQKERARNAAKFAGTLSGDEGWTVLHSQQGTLFVGYESDSVATKVLRYQEVGDDILVVLEKSPFYAESGGQVGDVGEIESTHKTHPLKLRVVDTFKLFDTQIHRCHLVQGLLAPKSLENVTASLDVPSRSAIVRHHSVTHLLHAALRKVLGPHVTQQGSRVAAEALRFDFTHPKALSPGELREVERLVNLEILANQNIVVRQSPIEEAKAEGATALFGEKYGDVVRHIKMGDFSHELCGGTHAKATGDLGSFRILSESSIASGIRRIEAVAGLAALERAQNDHAILGDVTRHLKIRPEELGSQISEYELKIRDLEKELKVYRDAKLQSQLKVLLENKKATPHGLDLLVQKLSAKDFPKDQLQAVLEHCADRLNNGVAIMTHIEEGLLTILVAVGVEARKKYKAGDLVRQLSEIAGGKGGGRPDRAQAGSKFPEKEPLVLERASALFD